jgi:phage terminase large subunit-like protein
MADNLAVSQDPAGNFKPDKKKSREKIDGMVAGVMALDRAVRHGQGEPGSVYEQRGLRLL